MVVETFFCEITKRRMKNQNKENKTKKKTDKKLYIHITKQNQTFTRRTTTHTIITQKENHTKKTPQYTLSHTYIYTTDKIIKTNTNTRKHSIQRKIILIHRFIDENIRPTTLKSTATQ